MPNDVSMKRRAVWSVVCLALFVASGYGLVFVMGRIGKPYVTEYRRLMQNYREDMEMVRSSTCREMRADTPHRIIHECRDASNRLDEWLSVTAAINTAEDLQSCVHGHCDPLFSVDLGNYFLPVTVLLLLGLLAIVLCTLGAAVFFAYKASQVRPKED